MKRAFFVTGLLLIAASAPASAYDISTVLDTDELVIEVPADAKWLGVAAGQYGFDTGTGDSHTLAIWRAVIACETNNDDDCSEFAALEIGTGEVVAIAYCADGLYDYYPSVGAGEDSEETRDAVVKVAEEWISGIEDEDLEEEETTEENEEEDPSTIVSMCESVVIKASR